jgi:xylan 1,4-beta-xylosidase
MATGGPTCGNQSMYIDLFRHTFAGLKAASPALRVGGPATAQLAWVDAFVAGAVAAGAPPDFVSSHLYHLRNISIMIATLT